MIISLIPSNLHSTKPLHLPHFSVPSSLIAPKNQDQNPRIPSASVPDDIRSPAFQERSWGITILRISQLKHWIVSQLTPHHQVRALTLPIPQHTLTLHTAGRMINTGYPWLVTRPETNTRRSLCKMSRPAMIIVATMGYPWLDLFHRFLTLVHTLHMLTRTTTSQVARQKATVGHPQLV